MQVVIIMRLALLDAGRAVLKRSWRIEGCLLIDLVPERRRREHGRRRVLQVVIIMRLALLDAGRAVLYNATALRGWPVN